MNPLRLARTVIGVGLTLLIADVRAQQPPVTVPTSKNVSSAAELAGLWKAQQWFGPYARGQLLIERTPAGWIADFAGRSLPVQARASELSFELPGDQGAFRGRLERNRIVGQWISPPSRVRASTDPALPRQ